MACLPRDNNGSPIYRRRAVSYVSTGLACLPRDNNARASTAEERLYKRQHMVGLHSLVAERRHSSVTRYAKRSVACRDSPRHQPLRAGGTPLPRHPSDCASPSSTIHRFAPSSQYIAIGEKTAEERFNMLARGWIAYPVTPTHHPSTAEERLYMSTHPLVYKSNDTHTNAITLQITYTTALRR